MARELDQEGEQAPRRRGRRIARRMAQALGVVLAMAVAGVVLLWSQRETLADDYIEQALIEFGVEATYEVESIGPETQVLRNIVVGDPDRPDATIDRAIVQIRLTFGLPQIASVTLDTVRLWGRVVDGQPSFGALDPLIFTDSDEPFALPDLDLTVIDGHALIEGDYGPIALSLDGSGHLQGGFGGELAVVAPRLALAGCTAEQATLYGSVAITDRRPGFAGPLRFDQLDCAGQGVSVAGGAAELELTADAELTAIDGEGSLRSGAVTAPSARLAALEGDLRLALRDGNVTSTFDLEGRQIETSALRLATLAIEGTLRSRDAFERIELEASLDGRNLQPGSDMAAILDDAAGAAEGTLAAPLLARMRQQLAVQIQASRLTGNFTLRQDRDRLAVVVPEARLRGRGGDVLLLLSRAQLGFTDSGVPLFSGNFSTGGAGLPQIAGRMEQDEGGALELRARMAEYTAGDASLTVPDLRVSQRSNGALALDGRIEASGALPGGFARGLELPLSGTVSPSGAVALWSACTAVRFDQLQLSGLLLEGRALTLCPPTGSSILRYDAGGLSVAAGVPSLQLTGTLGETPVRLSSGAVGFAWPGALSAKAIAVELGEPVTATRFTIADLSARLGDEIAGTFTGTDVLLAAVPLDILQAGGDWRFAGGELQLTNVAFRLEDRQETDRFKPLGAQGAVLTLADNAIRSRFDLAHPASGTKVAGIDLTHDLGSAIGHADIAVPGVSFSPAFQPRDITELAYGVVSVVEGTVTGSGRAGWSPEAITSSGTFSSDGINLAAAFGPVQGARGTVAFTDLIGLTTAPAQRIAIDSVNPGIEVNDGVVLFSLTGGTQLDLESAQWPFLGGQLSMQSLVMNIGVAEVRRYVFQIEGLEAARLVERMELANMSASGTFDGILPIVFDEMGNGRLEGGMLSARPPGGHVSYVGQLTYEDLSPMGNMAFQALRDLDYNTMEVGLNGPLTGELVTRVRLDGVRQGATAQTNFITRRIAQLPIRVVVNLRAPFYQMISSMRSLYDPSSVRDPRGLGLMTDDGQRLRSAIRGEDVPPEADPDFDEPSIQPPESEAQP
ncbi:YdbH domain-containing protein [Altererythrobacter sp. KTW20L]|uniref:intermembrane phospholipid transport protein YdbH family protein n=1 Tax=Altererythrobacter sp. KTW20L TaxID=2942210 RepID=UPI0020C136C6|nr:YdbH domain-containing protein [Altererythrobacter sp. KTW20L]MCL6251810.1 YdbH domain-containing protein [Altererythrobacter sp. KTW20L]